MVYRPFLIEVLFSVLIQIRFACPIWISEGLCFYGRIFFTEMSGFGSFHRVQLWLRLLESVWVLQVWLLSVI